MMVDTLSCCSCALPVGFQARNAMLNVLYVLYMVLHFVFMADDSYFMMLDTLSCCYSQVGFQARNEMQPPLDIELQKKWERSSARTLNVCVTCSVLSSWSLRCALSTVVQLTVGVLVLPLLRLESVIMLLLRLQL